MRLEDRLCTADGSPVAKTWPLVECKILERGKRDIADSPRSVLQANIADFCQLSALAFNLSGLATC